MAGILSLKTPANGLVTLSPSNTATDKTITIPALTGTMLVQDPSGVSNITTVNSTTVDTTNIEVTNLKAKDGTSAGSIADSTGVVTLASSVLTTTDINGGTIDGAVIGGTTPAAGTFTNLVSSADAVFNSVRVGRGGSSFGTNVVVGTALASNTAGENNTAIGASALNAITTGNGNTVIGSSGLFNNTTGYRNTAVGVTSLYLNTTGYDNAALGENALFSNTTGYENVAVGNSSLGSQTTGTRNTAIGYGAGSAITTGSKNVIIGAFGGNDGVLDIRTLSNYIVLSDGDGNPRIISDSSGNVGIGVTPSAWGGGHKALQLAGPSMWGLGGVGHWTVNNYFDGTNYKYIANGETTDYYQLNGVHQWRSAPSGTAGANITFNTGMRLNANGRLGIGTITTPVEVTLSSESTLGWEQSSTSTIANIFKQSSSASLVLGSGVKYSTNSNAFASSYAIAWARSAVVVGYGAITFNVAPEATVAIGTDTTVNERMRIDAAGAVTIPGALSAGSITETSSITYKENVNPIMQALDAIVQLTGVTYDRKDGSRTNEAGLIAEEVNKVLPNIVTKNDEGNPEGIQYTKLTAYLIECIKELKSEIDMLKGK
jgi:hypothetical protein